ncbi:restriction endonuclease subunit S [Photobacterium lucens]|uniref:restriction endonuclease subunit S n=1 Tax=Photobacterium lucens TaxID=2562949 RepID=UPI001369ECD4|nr:restriction endonuclease subunit S [Photobacterium lucens]MBP2698728.1 restriction endonuclease subunit S [Vibrio parahaemolyticus]MZG58114.1 restriction endonuclease subunit S [Photobacterium lucens]MZG79462.1 restriction endonuclease subunit S [Photobacterium lucens]
MVPNGWERKPLEKVAEIKTGVAKGKKGLKDPIEVPYLRVANVQDGHIDLSEVKTIQIERHQLERYSLQVGDVLMTEGGDFDKLGRGDVWQGQIVPCLNQNHVFAVRPNKQVLLPYFLAALSGSNYGKTYFLSCAKRSTNLASINSTQLKEFPVLLPPLPEQRKIAKILSTWDRSIATTKKLIDASKQQKKALMQQLLTGNKRLIDPETGKAFEGKWENTHLSNIASIKKGKALSAKNLVAGSYPVIAGGKSSPYSHVDFTHENVITVSASGAYAGYVSYHPYKIWASDCSVVTAKPANYLGFIFQWLQLNQIRIYSMQSGGAQPHIYPKDLEVMKLRVPKIEEQQKIASVLTAADKEIELLEAKLVLFKQEKKALMQQLLTGKRRVKVAETEAA